MVMQASLAETDLPKFSNRAGASGAKLPLMVVALLLARVGSSLAV